MSKVKTITLGCRFNFYESEVAKAMLRQAHPDEDFVVINTCSVTHEAERQSKQAVRKAIRENEGAKIIVTGCAAETSLEYFKDLKGIHKVILNKDKDKHESYSAEYFAFDNISVSEDDDYLFKNKARAFLQIQNGCDHFCTYCIIAKTRGRSRSMPLDEILQRVRYFDENGFQEIVLSGIDITSYGLDLEPKLEMADVVEAILKEFPNQKRIRISSIDPHGISKRLFGILATERRVMPHLHQSIQSGDNSVLKAMRRRHSREEVISLCNDLLSRRKDMVFGADFIAGFPTETDEMFENTLSIIDEAHLSLMHVFPFSPRKGTVAATMVQLPRNLILERAKILRKKAELAKITKLESMVGCETGCIIEKGPDSHGKMSVGKTDSFVQCLIDGDFPPGFVIEKAIVVGWVSEENFHGGALVLREI